MLHARSEFLAFTAFPLALLLISASLIPNGSAQTFSGSVLGTVTDNSGGVMARASVTLTNIGTSERKTTLTDSSGAYRFLELPPGRYRAEVESPGFKRLVRDQILVEVQAVLRIDVSMQVGDALQVVEVEAITPLLQTESATVSQVVDSKMVQEMPLNGRNVFSLMALVPGVVPQGNTGAAASTLHPNGAANFQISGGVANQSASFLDGAPINISWVNMVALVPAQDVVQEFRVQTSDASVEFGRFSGGVMSLTTKSGTNQFHGSVYEFLRNKVLNSNGFFSNRSGLTRPPFTQNQFGVTAGGPVIKDKTFFFAGYEGFRLRQGRTFLTTVPTEAFRNGNFSNLRGANGNLIPIYDALTTCGVLNNASCATNPNGTPNYTRTPFPGNVIPANRLDTTAKALTRTWALPNQPGQPFTQILNFATAASAVNDTDQFNFRGDHTVSVKQRLFGRYTRMSYDQPPVDPYGAGFLTHATVTAHQAVIGDTYTFSPSLIGDIRLSFLRYLYDTVNQSYGTDLTQIGWSPSFIRQMSATVIPQLVVQGFNDVVAGVSYLTSANNIYSIAPSVTKIAGRHTLKFGAELRRIDFNYAQNNVASGSFAFNNLSTAINPLAAGTTGNAFASYMLGYGASGNLWQGPYTAANLLYQGYYASDSFQLTRRLTLHYGLRWELSSPYTERYDRLTVLLPHVESPLARPTGLPLNGKLGVVNSPDWPSRYNGNFYKNLFAPRLGVAYRLTDRFVIRSGYGISYLPNDVTLYSGPFGSPVNNAITTWVPTQNGQLTPLNTLNNPYPDGLLQPPGHDPSFQSLLQGQVVSALLPNDPFAYTQQWNFTLQRQIGDGLAIQAGYVGSKGTHLPAFGQQLNQLSPQQMAIGSPLLQPVRNPFQGHVLSGALAGATVPAGQLLRPFPQYNGYNVLAPTNRDSSYHSLEVKMEKRFHEAGTMLASYTFSKIITNVETAARWLEGTVVGGGYDAVQDTFDLKAERAIGSFDARNRLVVSYALDLPIGRGKKILAGAGGVTNLLVSGWGVDGFSTFQAGFPLFPSVASNTSNSYNAGPLSNVLRPNVVAGCSKSVAGSAQSKVDRWFNTSCFSAPPAFTFGNQGRVDPELRRNGIANFDFSLFKNTYITERIKLQFRAEFFNLFNRVQFSPPGMSLGTPQFGVVGTQANVPRLVQLSLRVQY